MCLRSCAKHRASDFCGARGLKWQSAVLHCKYGLWDFMVLGTAELLCHGATGLAALAHRLRLQLQRFVSRLGTRPWCNLAMGTKT